MALVQIRWKPPAATLRSFGLVGMVVLGGLGGLAWWRESIIGIALAPPSAETLAGWLWIAAGVTGLLAVALPRALWPLWILLTAVTLPIGFVLSFVVLGFLYYIVLTPVGVLRRILGRDPLERQWRPDAASYWRRRSPAPRPERYFHQY